MTLPLRVLDLFSGKDPGLPADSACDQVAHDKSGIAARLYPAWCLTLSATPRCGDAPACAQCRGRGSRRMLGMRAAHLGGERKSASDCCLGRASPKRERDTRQTYRGSSRRISSATHGQISLRMSRNNDAGSRRPARSRKTRPHIGGKNGHAAPALTLFLASAPWPCTPMNTSGRFRGRRRTVFRSLSSAWGAS